MKLKNVSIATALLLALTGCGSGGGGGNSNPNANTTLNNDQTTQSQVEKQKAELKTLKSQLSQAQINQKQAEEKLKSAEKTHHQNLTNAKNNLATAQDNLAKTQLALKQAEEKLAVAQKNQSQPEQPKAELQALKEQLSQAQEAQKQAEEKLKLAEKTHHQNLTTAKNNLATAQDNLTKTQLALTQAEEKLAVAQKNNENYVALQEQLTEATQKLSIAQQEKLQAEKNLNDKLAEENKLMSRAEVLDFALHNGLGSRDSEEFADDFQNRSKSFVIDQLIYVHKIIAFKNLARRYGLPEEEVRAFTRENKNKTLEEAANLLESKREEIEQKRTALLNELLTIAKEKGLEDWEASNFVYGREHQSKEQALQQLDNYLIEKAERETKLNELIELAKEKGLEDWEAQNFANQNIENNKENVLENLNNLLVEKERSTIENAKASVLSWSSIEANEVNNLPEGLTREHGKTITPAYDHRGDLYRNDTRYTDIYNQKYSIIASKYVNEENINDPSQKFERYDIRMKNHLGGLDTTNIPNEGNAIYNGVAFTKDREGEFIYKVNFTDRKGEGKITGLDGLGNLTLHQGNVAKLYGKEWGVSSDMTSDKWQTMEGEYYLHFYGPNAEEVVGTAGLGKKWDDYENKKELEELYKVVPQGDSLGIEGINIGFGGTRGEIQK